MNSTNAITNVTPGGAPHIFRSPVLRALRGLERGSLELHCDGSVDTFGRSEDLREHPRCVVRVIDKRFYRRVALGGALGAGESYVEGEWETDDLTAVVRLMLRNGEALSRLDSGLAGVGLALSRLWGAAHPNTRAGSRRNIAAHYDLGNDFYRLMLDRTMSYSSGVFESDESRLEDASRRKIHLLFELLELAPEERLLEIGTGWGQLALSAAADFGARVTTTTISGEQYALARQRIAEGGMADRVELLQRDYRDLSGTFDKIVSVEMIEAIGPDQYDAFFRKCADLLVAGGLLAVQTITIGEQVYERHRTEMDFIKRHVFPGSTIPAVSALLASAARSGSLQLRSAHDYGLHYARTIAEWRRNLEPHRGWVVARYGASFWRLWMFYLAYCEAGFMERHISVKQMLFEKPKWRHT